jgi:Leucine-rich repeat (LRR) protein
MKKLLLFSLLLSVQPTFSQQTIPVFQAKKDSAEYTHVQAAIREIFASGQTANNQALDSLLRLQASLRSKIIGYKTIYQANASFTPWHDLELGKVKAEAITKLSVSGKQIKKLPASLYACEKLNELELVNTAVKKLPKKLGTLANLETIYVYNNTPNGRLALGKNKTTKQLMLRGLETKAMPRSFRKFVGLKELDLSANIGLTQFPGIYKNPALEKLTLIGNQLTLTDLRGKKSSVQELNLIGNKITHVPPAIANFPELKKLILSNNPLTTIDDAIGKLSLLEELAFYNCKLTELTPAIEGLKNLKQIDLYFNQLSKLNVDASKLTSLEILYLSNNQLTSLPDNLGSIATLQELYISNNKISYLPESISQLTNLRVLRMNNNYFASFPYGVVQLKNLENLDVSRNDLQSIPDELARFEKLQIFALVGNPWERKDTILKIAEELRAKGTVVHLNTLEEAVEDNR